MEVQLFYLQTGQRGHVKRSCKCIDQLDKKLSAEKGHTLDLAFSMTGKALPTLSVVRNPGYKMKRGERAPIVACTFCPFCGLELYPEKKPTKKAKRK